MFVIFVLALAMYALAHREATEWVWKKFEAGGSFVERVYEMRRLYEVFLGT